MDSQQQLQKHNETLFWKVYKNKYIRKILFDNLQTMNLEFPNQMDYYLGNRVPFKRIREVSWYLKKGIRGRVLLRDRLLNGNGNEKDNLIITINDINDLMAMDINSGDINETSLYSDIEILKLLYEKYKDQVNQVDLIYYSVKHHNLKSLKLFTEQFNVETKKNSMGSALVYGNIEIVDYFVNFRKSDAHCNKDAFLISPISLTRYLLDHPEIYYETSDNNNREPIINFKLFLSYDKEIQFEMVKRKMVIKETLDKIDMLYRGNKSFVDFEPILEYCESYYEKQVLLPSSKYCFYRLYIVKIIETTLDQKSNSLLDYYSKLFSNLKEFGITNDQFSRFLMENYQKSTLVQDMLSIHTSFKSFKYFVENLFSELQLSTLLFNWNTILKESTKTFTIDEKLQLVDVFIKKSNPMSVNQLISLVYPFNGFSNFNQSKQLYEKLKSFNRQVNPETNNYHLVLKSYFDEKIVQECQIDSMKDILLMIGDVDLRIAEIINNVDGIGLDENYDNYFKHCIGDDEKIIQFIHQLVLIKDFKTSSTSFFSHVQKSLSQDSFVNVLSVFNEVNFFITKNTIVSLIERNIENLTVLSELIKQFPHHFGSNQIVDLFNQFLNLENIGLLNLLLENFKEFFACFKFKVVIVKPELVSWFIENKNKFQKLNFSDLIDHLIQDSPLLKSSTFEMVLNFIISNNIYQLPSKKFKGDDADYVSYNAVSLIKNCFNSNSNNLEIQNNCKSILKLIYKNHNLFYWDISIFVNQPTFDQVDETSSENIGLDEIILDLLIQKPPSLPTPITSKKQQPTNKKNNKTTTTTTTATTATNVQHNVLPVTQLTEALSSSSKPLNRSSSHPSNSPKKSSNHSNSSLAPKKPSNLYQFKSLDFKNRLNELVGHGRVRDAIYWLTKKPIVLQIDYVEKIMDHCEFSIIETYFKATQELYVSGNDKEEYLYIVLKGRYDVFEFLLNHFQMNVNSDLFNILVETSARSNDMETVKYLLENPLFDTIFSKSKQTIGNLVQISIDYSNILLFNYLFENNSLIKLNYDNFGTTIPFDINYNSKFTFK